MGYIVLLHSTPAKVQLRRLSSSLGISRAHALGLLSSLWILADTDGRPFQAEDGGTDALLEWRSDELDDELGLAGAAAAIAAVGWLRILEDGSLVVPHFDRYNGAGGKSAVRHRERNARASEKRKTAAQRSGAAAQRVGAPPTNQPTNRPGSSSGAHPVGRAGVAPPSAPPASRPSGKGAPRDFDPEERVLSFSEARAAGVLPDEWLNMAPKGAPARSGASA